MDWNISANKKEIHLLEGHILDDSLFYISVSCTTSIKLNLSKTSGVGTGVGWWGGGMVMAKFDLISHIFPEYLIEIP